MQWATSGALNRITKITMIYNINTIYATLTLRNIDGYYSNSIGNNVWKIWWCLLGVAIVSRMAGTKLVPVSQLGEDQ